jgi:hypothetical protein
VLQEASLTIRGSCDPASTLSLRKGRITNADRPMISCPSGLRKMRDYSTAIVDALNELEAIDKNGQDTLELQHAEAIANASSARDLNGV